MGRSFIPVRGAETRRDGLTVAGTALRAVDNRAFPCRIKAAGTALRVERACGRGGARARARACACTHARPRPRTIARARTPLHTLHTFQKRMK